MLNMRERTDIPFKKFSGLALLRLLGKVILGLLTLQVLTAVVLLTIAALGKRRKHEVRFPHEPFEEVQNLPTKCPRSSQKIRLRSLN